MKKLLFFVVLLQFGQTFMAAEGGPGKRPGSPSGEPAAKRQQVPSAGSAQSTSESEGSESSQGEDEEFICQYCEQDFDSRRRLDLHKQSSCSQRPDLLNTQQDFIQWQQLFAQQQQLQQQLQQPDQQQLQQQLQQWQLRQWQLQQPNSGAQSTSRIPIPLPPSQSAAAAPLKSASVTAAAAPIAAAAPVAAALLQAFESLRDARYKDAYRANIKEEGEEFICLVDGCGKKFKKKDTALKHSREHWTVQNKIYPCDCNKLFPRRQHFVEHLMARSHGLSKEKADEYADKLEIKWFEEQQKSQLAEAAAAAQAAEEESDGEELTQEMQQQQTAQAANQTGGDLPVPLSGGKYSGLYKEYLRRVASNEFRCKDCPGKPFASLQNAEKHVRSKHEEKKFFCPHCQRGWTETRKADYHAHIRRYPTAEDHPLIPSLKSSEAAEQQAAESVQSINLESTSQYAPLYKQYLLESSPGEYECKAKGCNQIFKNKQIAQNHIKRQHAEKLLVCPYCPKRWPLTENHLRDRHVQKYPTREAHINSGIPTHSEVPTHSYKCIFPGCEACEEELTFSLEGIIEHCRVEHEMEEKDLDFNDLKKSD